MIQITLQDQAVMEALRELEAKMGDMTPAMQDIGQSLVEGTRQRIRDGKDWDGNPFAANAPATLARKRGTSPLIDRGNLAGSRLHYQASADAVTVGSSAVQAAVLQFGARRGQFGQDRRGRDLPWNNIPARPFLPIKGNDLPQSARDRVLEIIREHLES